MRPKKPMEGRWLSDYFFFFAVFFFAAFFAFFAFLAKLPSINPLSRHDRLVLPRIGKHNMKCTPQS